MHVILSIGPLARRDSPFLSLLYNRRHLGVTMFLLALTHATISIIQFHALGNIDPLVSIFTAYREDYAPGIRAISNFPFEPFGIFALVILFVMAATSRDFWLRNLGAGFWKLMHMAVYAAYGAILVHVAYGFLQSERNPFHISIIAVGFITVMTLHLLAYQKEAKLDRAAKRSPEADGYIKVAGVADLKEGRGKAVRLVDGRIGLFLSQGSVYALSNVCRHQGGPVGEGRIIDGCITCPWHGWQYKPDNGSSPPPFHEVIPTYRVRLFEDDVYVHPQANPLGESCPGAPTENCQTSQPVLQPIGNAQ